MIVFIEGIYIPNTNEWWIGEDWTVQQLKEDVIKLATSKQGDPNDYDVFVKNKKLSNSKKVSSFVEDGGTLQIINK